MRLSLHVLQALVVSILCFDASTLAMLHRSNHHHRNVRRKVDTMNVKEHQRRSDCDNLQVSPMQLQQLQQYTTAYHGWITAWLSQQPTKSPTIMQLQLNNQAYEGWINAWLSQAMGNTSTITNTSTPVMVSPPLMSAISSSATPNSAISYAASPTAISASSAAQTTQTLSAKPDSTASSSPIESSTPSPLSGVDSQTAATETPSPSSAPYASSAQTSLAISSTASPSASTTAPSSFNPRATDNIAVYWGSGALGTKISLDTICKDPNVNIVNLAFLLGFKNGSGYPLIDFSGGCGGQTKLQEEKGATGLLHCNKMASAIQTCQSNDKKVLLSIGGEAGTAKIDLESDEEAISVAGTLWDLFGGGHAETDLRPFGNVKLDGFDIDDENKKPEHYTTFVTTLRTKFSTDTSKKYYISAAPQCPFPDESIPLDAMQTMDFVWVQFYNNPPCGLGKATFPDSLKHWSQQLSAKGNGTGPRLFIGAPGCETTDVDKEGGCAGSGYVKPGDLKGLVGSVKGQVGNLGRMMLWDGSRATIHGNYQKIAKDALA